MAERIIRPAGVPAVPPPLALYVHLPWCVRKCPYCDFNSHPLRGELPEADYLDALERDLVHALPAVWGRTVVSVFIGGGTPSLFSAAAVERLLVRLHTLLPIAPGAEITLEANPGTVDASRFAGYRAAGVNRLSLGVQSFDDRHLAALGRIHDARAAHAAVEAARAAFDAVNLDLMYALPGQTLAALEQDLDTALGYAPAHLSVYQLTLEPNTAFAAAPPPLPDEELAADMQEAVETRLAAAGYTHYETSAYARPGHACRHNLNYWTFGDYLGIGAGAHSKLTLADGVWRSSRVRHPRQYLATAGSPAAIAESQRVRAQELPIEFMMNALRLTAGFAPELFCARTGLPWSAVAARIARAEALGLIACEADRVRPTERGRRLLNELLQIFLD
ncbi:MAG: radical SAM family heme chaperone HemW [Thiobacillaceae bacterium]|nr:radical SAM family heme chaperone HemW [Thiobacillaceae bacterium]MDW8323168.1 radical SAM family heme chaperone HemW [Burkholderiales bacterium]